MFLLVWRCQCASLARFCTHCASEIGSLRQINRYFTAWIPHWPQGYPAYRHSSFKPSHLYFPITGFPGIQLLQTFPFVFPTTGLPGIQLLQAFPFVFSRYRVTWHTATSNLPISKHATTTWWLPIVTTTIGSPTRLLTTNHAS